MKLLTFEELFDSYLHFHAVSHLSMATVKKLRYMLNYCKKTYPSDPYLTQEKIITWTTKRTNETNNTYNLRVRIINTFIKHVNQRTNTKFNSVPLLKNDRVIKDPVLFTEVELKNLFQACDELTVSQATRHVRKQQLINMIEIPILFRLLYSSGIRVNEVRFLNMKDVDLGIICIKQSKGYNERIIALHSSMLSLLVKYDKLIENVIPNRIIFFPDMNDKCHSKDWLSHKFRLLWNKYNCPKSIVAYSFRHNYAVLNINSLPKTGYIITKEILALSRSMGHKSLEGTLYYYHLVPQFANIYEDVMGSTLEQIIPEI